MSKLLPRGIRNNNPLNIRKTKIKWQGKIEGTDPEFETFSTPVMGLRAAARNLLNYEQNGLNTVRLIINRWAPPNENNTNLYVSYVANSMGVDQNTVVDLDDFKTMLSLIKAMIIKENGYNPYSDELIAEALHLAGVTNVPPKPVVATVEGKAATVTATAGAVSVAGAAVSAVAPAFPLLQTMIQAAPWVVGALLIAVAVYLIASRIKARENGYR